MMIETEQPPTDDADVELNVINGTISLLVDVLTVGDRNLPRAKAAELRRGLDSGELVVRLTCIWGLAGTSIRADAVNLDGVGTTILETFVPPPGTDETEPLSEEATPPTLN